jgi:hypothetical protein
MWIVTVRKGRKWNEYHTTGATAQEAQGRVQGMLGPGWRIVAIEPADQTPHYTPYPIARG